MRKINCFVKAAGLALVLGMTAGMQSCSKVDVPVIDEPVIDEPDLCNLLADSEGDISFYYANADWSAREEPDFDGDENSMVIIYPQATSAQWQNQVRFTTDLAVNAETRYDFTATVISSTPIANAIIKGEKGDVALFEVDYSLAEAEKFVAVARGIEGKDIENLEIVFDFGGNPDNTIITLSDIVLKESDCGKALPLGDNEVEISLDGTVLEDGIYVGELVQGKAYDIKAKNGKGEVQLFTAPFFEDGKFVAVTGNYYLSVNATTATVKVYPVNAEGQPATIADGGLWIIGQGIGFPSAGNEPGWNTGAGVDIAVPQVKQNVYQMKVIAGQQIWTNWHNFKFFGQADWGIEFVSAGDYVIASQNDYIGIGDGHNQYDFDNGNTFVKKEMEEGKAYTITIDFTAGFNAGVITVE